MAGRGGAFLADDLGDFFVSAGNDFEVGEVFRWGFSFLFRLGFG